MNKTASGLIEYCKAQLGLPYWMGTFGQIATKALYEANKRRLPSYYTASDFPSQYGKRVHDCVGLIKGYRWSATLTSTPVYNASQDVAVSGLYNQCSKRGLLKTMPKVPGTCVFMSGHVGVYTGDGYVIEARGHAYGVVKTKLTDRPWTKWGQPDWLTYDTADETQTTPIKTERKGVDISYANGTINWSNVKGVDFTIIRVGCGDYRREGSMHEDSQFRANVAGAKSIGAYIGYYWFCYAQTASEAKKEADFCCDLIDKYGEKPNYPVCFDYEYDSEKKAPPKDNIVDIARAFLSRVKERGYYPANYTNIDYLSRGFSKLTGEYDTWLAQWSVSKPSRDCGIWQYTSSGSVSGIAGNVDMDISYKDYPRIIGGETPTQKPTTEDTCMVECSVIKKGSTGNTVKSWQTLLNYWGYNCGTVDGDFGTKTDTATKKFQKDYGLNVDGIVGSATWGKMLS